MAVRLLGPVEITGPDGDAVFSGGRQRALVAALAFNAGAVVASSRLVDALWGAEPPRTAFKTLHGHIARLRRVLVGCGLPDLLVTSGQGYLLAAARSEVDSLRFEDIVAEARAELHENRPTRAIDVLREGLSLWRGDPVPDGELFGWGEAEVSRLAELRLTALEDLCDAELSLGRHGAVVAELERLLIHHPWRERLVELVMRAYHRSGRTADALQAYQRLRARLADDLGVDPPPRLLRLYTAILRHDERPPAGETNVAAPAQLPPRVGHFAGRHEQLRALDEALEDSCDTRIVVVHGAGGMGKTAVVVQWAHANRHRFPDGQLFVDLRGHDERLAMTATAALVHCLRALGVPEARVPGERPEQVGLLRSLLDGRRVLIVLDNAADTEQILPLVPPTPTSMLMVTSRRTMAGLTTYHLVRDIQLDAMTSGESLAMLREVVGAKRIDSEPAEATTIVTGCAGLPLALRIAAAKLVHRPEMPLGGLAAELSTVDRLGALRVHDGSREVRAVFASAYRTLSASAAALFRRLGVHPEISFGMPLAAAVSGLHAGAAERALAELASAHLITAIGGGRYRFHDLIGLYANECAHAEEEPGIRAETVTRLLDWYLGGADAANRAQPSTHNRVTPDLTYPPAVQPFADDHQGALAFFDIERPNLLPVVRFAAGEGRDVAAWQLVYLVSVFYSTRGRWEDRIELCRLGLAAAQRIGDARAEGLMGGALGLAYLRMWRFTEAINHLYPAMQRAQEAGDAVGAGRIRNNIGTAYARLRRYDEAVEIYQQALAAQLDSGDQLGIAVALNNLGLGRLRQGQPELGLAHLGEALRLTRQAGDQRIESLILLDLGEACLAQEKHDEALQHYRQALKLQQAIDDRQHQVQSLIGIGTVKLAAGEHRAALDHLRDGHRISLELGDQHQISLCLKVLAQAHLCRGELEPAGDCLRQALAIRATTPDAYEEAAIHRALSELARHTGHGSAAEEHRQRAVWLYRSANAASEAEEMTSAPA